MKIANKIFVLVVFLILALALNTAIALRQVERLGDHLREIADTNIVLSDVANTITQRYLENAIRFQALLAAGDELAFVQMTPARRQYLLTHIDNIKSGFDRLTQEAGEAVIKGKKLVEQHKKGSRSAGHAHGLQKAESLLGMVETAYVEYDQLFNEIHNHITQGGFELSLEDLARINQKEKALNRKIKTLLDEIRNNTNTTLQNAALEERRSRSTLVLTLQIIILIAMATSLLIIRSFSGPLKGLVRAAQAIGAGNFSLQLDPSRRDEIGEVSQAFNTMSRQLADFKEQLQKQNEALAQSLQTTRSQKEDMERINTELDRFVYTVSHDIAAPLTGIEGYGDYLEKNYWGRLDERGQRSLGGLRKATKRMTMMIRDLLALTRISRIKNPYEEVDVAGVLETVLERLEFLIRESGAKVEILGPLPKIICDRVKLTEVFDNLINNAIKFSSKYQKAKGGAARIEVGYSDCKGAHEFWVRDNGIGIPIEGKDEVFGLFKRLDNALEYEGTGAGLTIVKAGVEDQGGRVWFEGNEGDGVTFYFTVPKGLPPAPSSRGMVRT